QRGRERDTHSRDIDGLAKEIRQGKRGVTFSARIGKVSVDQANRASFRVTHWVVPSTPARSPREPRFVRASRLWRDSVQRSNRKFGVSRRPLRFDGLVYGSVYW